MVACGLMALGPGCVSDTASQSENISAFEDLYEDGKNLDLGDLLHVTADWATNELNDYLEITPFFEMKLEDTELYALGEDAEGDHTLNDIDRLITNLVHDYGARELTTEVNVLRRNHLLDSDDEVYAESAFEVKYGLHNWGHMVSGFGDSDDDNDATLRIGFDFGETLTARVIGAHESELDAVKTAPLEAIKRTRGFIIPRGVEDVANMKPGESYALQGKGRLGFNLALGVPILTTIIDALTYNIVLSAGMRSLLEGQVDVQLVRLEGDRVVVDVGVQDTSLKSGHVAISDGWGVAGLVKSVVGIGSVELNLGRLVDRALRRRLDRKLSLIDAPFRRTSRKNRISVARFRLDLSAATPDSPVERALSHLLHADLRLAQALANRDEPGIETDFEMTRSGTSTASIAGIDILGLRFFRESISKQGNVVVQTPGGAQAINFDSLHKEYGFIVRHGYTRVGLSGMLFDVDHPEGARGDANLIVQLMQSAPLMERDTMLDHIDGILLGLGGLEAMDVIQPIGNELVRYVEYEACARKGRSCRVSVLEHQKVKDLRAAGKQGISALLSSKGLSDDLVLLGEKAAEMRLTAQATYEPKAQWKGVPSELVADYRLDDTALTAVLTAGRAQYEAALENFIGVSEVDRSDKTLGHIDADWINEVRDHRELVEAAGDIYEAYAGRYGALLDAEEMTLDNHPQLGEMGPRALEIRFAVDTSNTPKYEEAIAQSIAQARSDIGAKLFDALRDKIKRKGKSLNHPEQVTAYSLLALTPTDHQDLRFAISMDLDNNLAQGYDQYRAAGYASLDWYGKGDSASRIDGGLFDVDQLIDLD